MIPKEIQEFLRDPSPENYRKMPYSLRVHYALKSTTPEELIVSIQASVKRYVESDHFDQQLRKPRQEKRSNEFMQILSDHSRMFAYTFVVALGFEFVNAPTEGEIQIKWRDITIHPMVSIADYVEEIMTNPNPNGMLRQFKSAEARVFSQK